MGIIRILLSLYLTGYILYHLLPITPLMYVHHSPSGPAPLPFHKQCAYAINPRTLQNSPLGNPRKLQKELKERNLLAYHTEERVLGYRDVSPFRWLAYLLFEYTPKRLLLKKPEDPYSLVRNSECLPLASDMPILLSLWNLDFPSYPFILGERQNLIYSDFCENNKLSGFIPFIGSVRPHVYAYSDRGFHFPSQNFKTPAVLVVDLLERKTLLFLSKDGKPYKTFNQRLIREKIEEPGEYRIHAYTYKAKVWKVYLGLRFLLCTPPFQAM